MIMAEIDISDPSIIPKRGRPRIESRKPRGNRLCCHGLCKSDTRKCEEDVVFVPFPKPCKAFRDTLPGSEFHKKHKLSSCPECSKCARWIHLCRRADGRLNIESIGRNTHICSKHFSSVAAAESRCEDPSPATTNRIKKRRPPPKIRQPLPVKKRRPRAVKYKEGIQTEKVEVPAKSVSASPISTQCMQTDPTTEIPTVTYAVPPLPLSTPSLQSQPAQPNSTQPFVAIPQQFGLCVKVADGSCSWMSIPSLPFAAQNNLGTANGRNAAAPVLTTNALVQVIKENSKVAILPKSIKPINISRIIVLPKKGSGPSSILPYIVGENDSSTCQNSQVNEAVTDNHEKQPKYELQEGDMETLMSKHWAVRAKKDVIVLVQEVGSTVRKKLRFFGSEFEIEVYGKKIGNEYLRVAPHLRSQVLAVAEALGNLVVCDGITGDGLEAIFTSLGARYPSYYCPSTKSVRSSTCSRVAGEGSGICKQCLILKRSLMRRENPAGQDKSKLKTAHNQKNHRYMSREELMEELKRKTRKGIKCRIRETRLIKKIEVLNRKLIEQDSDLGRVLAANAIKMKEKIKDKAVAGIIMDEQLRHFCKKGVGFKWNPILMNWCSIFYSKSPASYRCLRKMGVLRLPSEKTLFKFSHLSNQTATLSQKSGD